MRGLEYFCVRAAPSMGMYFDAEFWNHIVVQASVAQPALAHLMISIGVFAEQREFMDVSTIAAPGMDDSGNETPRARSTSVHSRAMNQNDPVALLNYNKSIGLLAKSTSPENVDTVLLAVILFVCVEFLRGDEEAALRHFKGGMAIITNTNSGVGNSYGSPSMSSHMKSTIMPFFNRLETLYILFGNDASWQYPVTLYASVPETISTIGQARESLVHLMNLSLRFLRRMGCVKYKPAIIPSSALEEQIALLGQLELWHSLFLAYQAGHTATADANARYAAKVLEIHRLIAYIWLSVSLSPFECAHDEHISSYASAVSLAEQLPTIAGTEIQRARYSSTFIVDMEIVGPLHWVSIKCQDPAIRRRAITVQRSTHRREGVWDSKMTAAVAESVLAAEEAGLKDGELPCEDARVHNSVWMQEPGIGPSKNVITHHTKPYGVFGEWAAWQELISIGEE